MSKRITLDNLKTFLTQLKTHITDPIKNDVSTLNTKVRNAENNIITANSNISSVQQALNDKADKNHNHDSVYVKQDGSNPITSPLQLKQGSYVLQTNKVNGIYVFVAEIRIWAPYQNRPIKFEIVSRGHKTNCTCYIQFKNHWTNDPDIESFGYTGFSTDYSLYLYMVKTDTSTWDLYIKKTEENDTIDITDFSNMNTNTSIIWKNEGVSTLPEGGIYASPLQYVTNNKFALQVNVKHYINNSELLTYVDADNTQMQFKKSGLYKITVTKANNQTSGISFCDTSLDFETKGNVVVGYNVGLYEPVSSSLVMYIDKTKTYEFFGFETGEYHGATSYTKYRGAEFKTKLQGSNILIELIKEC